MFFDHYWRIFWLLVPFAFVLRFLLYCVPVQFCVTLNLNSAASYLSNDGSNSLSDLQMRKKTFRASVRFLRVFKCVLNCVELLVFEPVPWLKFASTIYYWLLLPTVRFVLFPVPCASTPLCDPECMRNISIFDSLIL